MKGIVIMILYFSTMELACAQKKRPVTEKMALILYKSRYLFSSIVFMKRHMAKRYPLTGKLERLLERLIARGGSSVFIDMDDRIFKYYSHSTGVNFIFGLKAFYEKKYSRVKKMLESIPDSHILGTEKFFILGVVHSLARKRASAHSSYEKCVKNSRKWMNEAKSIAMKRYQAILNEKCIIHRGRLFYEQKKYKKSLDTYDRISKNSHLWPSILLEKAWSNYQLENYNRSLGLLWTYKSPVLSGWFFPEADVLMALSFTRLCLWPDVDKIVDEYKLQLKDVKKLAKRMHRHKKSNSYFLKMAIDSVKNRGQRNDLEKGLFLRLRKKIKFNQEILGFIRLKKEYKKVRQGSLNTLVTKYLNRSLGEMMGRKGKYLNFYVKKYIHDFLNEMGRFDYEISKIGIEAIRNQRSIVYQKKKKKKKVKKRITGSFGNIRHSSTQHFYDFNGEFWADELGDYSFGLTSSCTVSKGKG